MAHQIRTVSEGAESLPGEGEGPEQPQQQEADLGEGSPTHHVSGAGSGAAGGAAPSKTGAEWQLAEAVRVKGEGNSLYRERRFRTAIGRYHRALLILRALDPQLAPPMHSLGPPRLPLTPQQEELLRDTEADCYNNLAACLLQRGGVDYARVREYSERVLRWRQGNVKALYRAGLASLQLGDPRTARHYLTQASKGQPNDPNVRRYLQQAEEGVSREQQREKSLYSSMFTQHPH
ncbi:tetratricopeptide repeat protein 9C [Amia ocellicauda]|uniref:tetratricopeptide repeat protein 9C n=1 Tax=Amia ocellicauda TaxID=2972642 RepID=UPI003464E70B